MEILYIGYNFPSPSFFSKKIIVNGICCVERFLKATLWKQAKNVARGCLSRNLSGTFARGRKIKYFNTRGNFSRVTVEYIYFLAAKATSSSRIICRCSAFRFRAASKTGALHKGFLKSVLQFY